MVNKILTISDLSKKVEELKNSGLKVVQCHGAFDLLHPGHLKHFEAAKKFGDVLVVTLTEDKHINKGPGRPIFNEDIRSETVAAIGIVDFVAINRHALALPAIKEIKPNFYVKGQEYEKMHEDITGGIYPEKEAIESVGGKLVFTHEPVFSSSKLINRHMGSEDGDLGKYLKEIREKYKLKDFNKFFDIISEYEVTIIGDTILDEYQFVNPIGKSSKSPTITAKLLDYEMYGGGTLAVANHIADFVKKVNLITTYGLNENGDYFDFIRKNLHPNVELKAIYTPDRPTTIKKRLVDKTFKHKLFEIIEIDDSPLEKHYTDQVIKEYESIKNHDLVIIADFGHGLMNSQMVNFVVGKKDFLAINVQTNSANKGFNVVTKYPRCNYFSIDKEEAQLALHSKEESIENVMNSLLESLNSDFGAITLGVNGCLMGNKDGQHSTAPVLSNEVVDTIGAGDAFLSITSLLVKAGMPLEMVSFTGNAVGAMAVKILGNKDYIKKVPLLKYLKVILA
ncbi:MAG: PfkB family carbohydrate kinase [Cytophagales bacterium]